MRISRKRIWSIALAAAILLSVFALMLILNSKTPLYKDDYSYSYTFAVKENKFRISTLDELIDSQINHYRVMNGRILPHTLAQAFLMTDKTVFNVINAAAFTLLVFLIYYHATKGTKSNSLAILLAAFVSLFLLTPRFGESFLWLTGACNYLWGMLLMLLYLVPVTKRYTGHAKWSSELLSSIGLLLLGYACTLTGENTSAALIVMSALFAVYASVNRKRPDLPLICGLIGNICGFLTVLLAPGQSVRLANNGGSGGIAVWLGRLVPITKVFLWPLLVITVISLVIGSTLRRDRRGLWKPLVFFVGGLVSVYSMVISPYFPDRVWSGPTVLLTLSALSAVSFALPKGERLTSKLIALVISVCMLVPVAFVIPKAYGELCSISELDRTRTEQIVAAAETGENRVTVDSIYGQGRYTCFDSFGDLNADSSTWPNTALAMYFGIDEVEKNDK